MPTEYVVGFLFSRDLSQVALIRKNRPAWMAGKLNGVGGHIEEDEEPAEAMEREFNEETGAAIGGPGWMQFARLHGDNNGGWAVHFFWAVNQQDCEIRIVTDEKVAWYSVSQIIAGSLPAIPNLRWLLPMALNDVGRLDVCSFFDIHERDTY